MIFGKFNIKIFYNIFSEKERIKILEQSKSHLYRISDSYPGFQTNGNLHEIFYNNLKYYDPHPKIFKRLNINLRIISSWINYVDYDLKYTSWHLHEQSKYSAVYMIENPDRKGTVFNFNGTIFKTFCPTNSLLFFPSHILHTVPEKIKKPRYTLAIDFV